MSAPGGFPWLEMYDSALRMGLSPQDFWHSSPRALVLLVRGRRKGGGAARAGKAPVERVRLSRIPRP